LLQGIGLICLECERGQYNQAKTRAGAAATDAKWNQPNRGNTNIRKNNNPAPLNRPHTVPSYNFGTGGAVSYPKLPLQSVYGGASVLQQQPKQQQQQQRQQQRRPSVVPELPSHFPQPNSTYSNRRNTRQATLDNRVVRSAKDHHGSDANPITILSDGDTDDDNDNEESAFEKNLLRIANLADNRRTTRLTSGVINPSAVKRLQGLRCLMPPEGGSGAVEFTAADLARLAPDEFLNDTAIDYYLRYLRMKLEQERPEDAQRCYFFNSFFYKKLSERNTGGGGGQGSAAASYAKVKKWTRGVDIFSKDYVFVPIHDHLHWSLMIICHPGAEVPRKTRKRPGSATGSGNSGGGGGGGGAKKRAVGSDVVVVTDATDDDDDDENPTIKAHRKAATNTAPAPAEEVEIEEVVDPRLTPHPEPFFLHLDSLSGGHNCENIAKILKSYLKCEWDARVSDPKGADDSVPKKWLAEQLAKKEKGKKKTTAPAAAADGDAANDDGAGPSAPPIPNRFFTGVQSTKMNVPRQDNHCDCGLFVCAFVEFFTAALPKSLNTSALTALRTKYHKDALDLWEGTMRPGGGTTTEKHLEKEEEPAWYPGFLTKFWFKHANASNLRWELLKMVLVHMGVSFNFIN
jgi:Ulp1 family protease